MSVPIGMPIGHRPTVHFFSDINREWKVIAEQVREGDYNVWRPFCSDADFGAARKMFYTENRTIPRLSACQGVTRMNGKETRVLYVRLHPHAVTH